jgi:endonuclease/exonuclease/phosphatase (EEP) superfamily protein YafD
VLNVSAWIVTGLLALLVLGRLVHLDDALWPYAMLDALTPVVYLPAYVIVVLALLGRRYPLVAVAGVVVVLHLIWLVPTIWPGSAERLPAGATPIRLLTANLEQNNAGAGDLGSQIRAAAPDIVVLEELTPITFVSMQKSGSLAGYQYSAIFPEFGAMGAGVWSRFPLSEVATPVIAGFQSLRMTVTPVAGHAFELFAVHTLSPRSSSNVAVWRAQLADLRSEVRSATLPVVLAGDFNATRDHRPFRRLVATGLRDAHDVVGAGWRPTWNNKTPLVGPLLGLDHVLASKQFAVTGYRVGSGFGSDHLPLLVTLGLRASQ